MTSLVVSETPLKLCHRCLGLTFFFNISAFVKQILGYDFGVHMGWMHDNDLGQFWLLTLALIRMAIHVQYVNKHCGTDIRRSIGNSEDSNPAADIICIVNL